MILIAHRGNTHGPIVELENSPQYIIKAINQGFDVEIDVWNTYEGLFLGHNRPEYCITNDFLYTYKDKLWIHCKKLEAICCLKEHDLNNELNYFGHENDDYVLTSKNYLFCKATTNLDKNCVLVMPEFFNYNCYNEKCFAILTDFPVRYQKTNIYSSTI